MYNYKNKGDRIMKTRMNILTLACALTCFSCIGTAHTIQPSKNYQTEKRSLGDIREVSTLSSTDSQATQAGFLVFATDSSKVEVFLPDTKVILDRRVRPDGIAVWNVEDDDTYQVQACADSWIVSRRGRLLYNTHGTDKKIETSFLTEEKTEIPVAFYPHEALAEVCLDGQYMLLSQYRTASGYGYKNTILDLRGKGKEATLTRSTDGKTFQLTEKD
jgi:membrane-bound inhibitor of C-type lysozyme